MGTRRLVLATALLATATAFFTLGIIYSHRQDASMHASYDARLDQIRAELSKSDHDNDTEPTATSGRMTRVKEAAVLTATARAGMMAEMKQDLQREMGLLPVTLLRAGNAKPFAICAST